MVRLQPVEEKDRELLWNINQKYLYEMTNFYNDPMDKNGNYHYRYFDEYFSDPKRTAYFIYDDDSLIGFAFLCPYSDIGREPDHTMAEFTIFPAYRRNHFALDTVKMIFEKHPGKWEIKYNEKNTGAKRLWNTLAAPFAPEFYHLNEEETVLSFETNAEGKEENNTGTEKTTIKLVPMTSDMYHCFFKEYENDPDLLLKGQTFNTYTYSEELVDNYIQRQKDLKRIPLAILCDNEIVGEIIIKNIEEHKCATMGLTLKNAKYKDHGIGTAAERLAIRFVFDKLDIPTLYADTVKTNLRSQHVLEKVGFVFIREDEDFKYYRIER